MEEQVVQNLELAGPGRCFLVEPTFAHDQELCVLSVAGGRLQLLAGRSLVLERVLMLRGEAPRVCPACCMSELRVTAGAAA